MNKPSAHKNKPEWKIRVQEKEGRQMWVWVCEGEQKGQ